MNCQGESQPNRFKLRVGRKEAQGIGGCGRVSIAPMGAREIHFDALDPLCLLAANF